MRPTALIPSTPMSNFRGICRASVLLTTALSLAACGSSTPPPSSTSESSTGPSTGSSLTVSALVAEIKPAADTAGAKCPIAYDIASAGQAAGLTGAVSAADDPVDAVTDSSATGSDFLKQVAPAATLQCSYKMGDSTVHVLLVAVNHTNTAISAALPQISFWVGGSPAALTSLVQAVNAAPAGQPVTAPANKAAVVRLKVTGGDALITVAVEGPKALSASPIGALTQTLATQVH